jgi:type II secretory pathway pseudopilin PulG
MESYRQGRRLVPVARDRQRGITFLGLVILAVLVGIVGFAAMKVTPMYINNMRLAKVLEATAAELSEQGGASNTSIQYALSKRFSIEDVNLPKDAIKIAPSKNGFSVRITYENRASYIADIWLVVVFDKSVEIKK